MVQQRITPRGSDSWMKDLSSRSYFSMEERGLMVGLVGADLLSGQGKATSALDGMEWSFGCTT
jgi:hypothetical protein